MLQLIKKPESAVNGTAVQEVQDEKANSLTLQEPRQIDRNIHYFLYRRHQPLCKKQLKGKKEASKTNIEEGLMKMQVQQRSCGMGVRRVAIRSAAGTMAKHMTF